METDEKFWRECISCDERILKNEAVRVEGFYYCVDCVEAKKHIVTMDDLEEIGYPFA